MAEPRYRVGVIGTGRIASTIQDEVVASPFSFLLPYSHAGAYEAHPATSIVAAADPSAEQLGAFGERWSVDRLYADYQHMLSTEDLDIVSVCVPTRAHAQVMSAITTSGVRGVFMEKPIGRTLREADDMIAATDQAGIRVVVNHVRTFDPYYRAFGGCSNREPWAACAASWRAGTKGCLSAAPTFLICCGSCSGRKRAGSSAISMRGMGSSIREEVA